MGGLCTQRFCGCWSRQAPTSTSRTGRACGATARKAASFSRDGPDTGKPRRALTSVPGSDPARPVVTPLGGGALGGAVPVIGNDTERYLPWIACLAALKHRVACMGCAHFHRVLGFALPIGRQPNAARINDQPPVV